MKRILLCNLHKIYDIHFPCRVPGSANYHVDTVNRRYFGPISPPVFVNPGGTKIKVKVGETVTIPCKIHNKGKFDLFFFVFFLKIGKFFSRDDLISDGTIPFHLLII